MTKAIEEQAAAKQSLKFWEYISANYRLSESFISKYKDLVDWESIVIHQVLSEDFIIKHEKYIDIELVYSEQTISEGFIEIYLPQSQYGWEAISRHQSLSLHFIKKHRRYIDMFSLSKNFYIDYKIFKEFEYELFRNKLIII